jgi:hypothetical protein
MVVKGKAGKIYILRNPCLRDAIVKIGRTSRISEKRAKEISGSTGVPQDFEVLYEEDVFDSQLAEKLVHERLIGNRVNPKREFFQLPLKLAVKTVFETCLEVNAGALEDASTRIVIITNENRGKYLVQQLAEVLSSHKGGSVGVYMLMEFEKTRALFKIGDEWDVELSPQLVNDLRRLKGVSDVLWASRDLVQMKERSGSEEGVEF